MLGYFILMGVAGFVLFLACNNRRRWKVLYSCIPVAFRPIWTRLRSWGFGGGAGAGARWANKRFVGDGGERRCSSRQRRKPWEASSP